MNSEKASILFAEDDDSLGFIIKDNLELAGYEIHHATDGLAAWEAFQAGDFQLCLLDVMLPKMDGFELAEKIRLVSAAVPFLFLTARSLKEDRIKGLKMGADDYIVKPFSIEELILRIQVALRRSQPVFPKKEKLRKVKLGAYECDFQNFEISFGGDVQKLTARESELLEMLVNRKEEVVSREEILEAIWGENDYFKGRSMDVFISRLRKYLKSDTTISIENIHGVGFRLTIG